jgi:hypothetical protein
MRDAHQIRWMRARNDSGYDVPPHGVVEVTSAFMANADEMYLSISRPTSNSPQCLAINSFQLMPSPGWGLVTFDSPIIAAYDPSDSPVAFQSWGAKSGTFTLGSDSDRFMIIGAIDTDKHTMLVDSRMYSGFKQYINFKLSETMTTSMSTADAEIVLQFGVGSNNPNTGAAEITVHNFLNSSSAYEFYGDTGKHGTAAHIGDNDYLILTMECPT